MATGERMSINKLLVSRMRSFHIRRKKEKNLQLFTELCTSSPHKGVYIVEVNIQSTTVAKALIWAHSWTSTWHSHNWCSTLIMDISFAKKFSPALKGKYKSGSKLGSNGTDVVRSPILTCLNIGRSIAEVVSCKASPERIHKKLGKPNMAACKEP